MSLVYKIDEEEPILNSKITFQSLFKSKFEEIF
jgi:hypothetical protein